MLGKGKQVFSRLSCRIFLMILCLRQGATRFQLDLFYDVIKNMLRLLKMHWRNIL